jgi:hypothetical protein
MAYSMPIPNIPSYCLAYILLTHKDFFKQKSAISILIKERGYKYVFIPKFYYKLNTIEIYWGYSKARYRQVKKISFDYIKKEVLITLNIYSINTMQRFYNRSLYFIDAYYKGLGVKAAA